MLALTDLPTYGLGARRIELLLSFDLEVLSDGRQEPAHALQGLLVRRQQQFLKKKKTIRFQILKFCLK